MKLTTFVVAQAAASAAFAAPLPLGDFCEPFDGARIEVVWAAPTSAIPKAVRLFKVVPTRFSSETVSNALGLAGLKLEDKKRPNQVGVLAGKGVLTFENREGTRHLDIVPAEGTIAFTKREAIAGPKEAVVNVPNTNEAIRRLVGLLPKLGIPKSEIVADATGEAVPYSMFEQTDFHRDKATAKVITNVISRAVSLSRQIDGIPVWGAAGAFAHFGNEGELANLSVTWRAIQPSDECSVPSPSNFVAIIRAGRSLIRNEQAGERYTKITIRKVQLYYWENDGSTHQSKVYPFAVLESEAGIEGALTNIQLFVSFANQRT